MIREKILSIVLLVTVTPGIVMGFPLKAHSQVTLTIRDANGAPASCAPPVGVSLENPNDRVKGVSVDVCDVGDYLIRLGCETTERTPDFECKTNELENGCVKVLLFSGSGSLIEKGTGSIFALKYGIVEEAPHIDNPGTEEDERCRDLNLENVLVAGEGGDPIRAVTTESGEICFFVVCGSDAECDDGVYCNGAERCVEGECVEGSNPCPDDGLFCTGVETCDEGNDTCVQSGDPCAPLECDEENDVCLCTVDEECDDGLFCNGDESCVGGACRPGTNPCPETECNTCQEDTDSCYDPVGTSCDDDLYCNGDDTCDGQGNCAHSGDPCPPLSTCNEQEDLCNCSQDEDCYDGLYCTGEGRCAYGICADFYYHSDYPCRDCYQYYDCDCDEENDMCQPVTITVGEGSGLPGSTGNAVDVSLDSLFVKVVAVTMDVCDVDDYLTCTGCDLTERSSGFDCIVNELEDGCCRVVLFPTGGLIEGGTGPIFTIAYDVSEGAPEGECRGLNPGNVDVAESEFNSALYVNSVSGQFCF